MNWRWDFWRALMETDATPDTSNITVNEVDYVLLDLNTASLAGVEAVCDRLDAKAAAMQTCPHGEIHLFPGGYYCIKCWQRFDAPSWGR